MCYLKKSQIKIKTTFATVTDESAQFGDYSETGWIDKKGIVFDSCQDAADWLCSQGYLHPSSSMFHKGIWYTTEPNLDMYDGSSTEESFHITASEELQLELYNRVIGID